MAAAYREKSTATATASSVEGTLPSGSVAGDILIAAFGTSGGGGNTFNTPSGWTLLESDTSGDSKSALAVFAREYDAGPWTFSMSGSSDLVVSVVAISGARPVYDSAVTKSSGNTTSHTLPSVTASAAGVLVAAIQCTASATYNSWTGSLAEVVDTGNQGVAHVVVAAGATGDLGVTSSNSKTSVSATVWVDSAKAGAALLMASL